ncbi:MAG: two-CW domain-containing protein [Nitrospirota bacterium]
MKKNCWEFKNCGRQPDGEHVRDLGICPSATETKLDGIHGGINAGRTCWVVAGTFCKGQVQGTFGQKYKSCEICDFYRTVKQEEHLEFKLSAVILDKLRSM